MSCLQAWVQLYKKNVYKETVNVWQSFSCDKAELWVMKSKHKLLLTQRKHYGPATVSWSSEVKEQQWRHLRTSADDDKIDSQDHNWAAIQG